MALVLEGGGIADSIPWLAPLSRATSMPSWCSPTTVATARRRSHHTSPVHLPLLSQAARGTAHTWGTLQCTDGVGRALGGRGTHHRHPSRSPRRGSTHLTRHKQDEYTLYCFKAILKLLLQELGKIRTFANR